MRFTPGFTGKSVRPCPTESVTPVIDNVPAAPMSLVGGRALGAIRIKLERTDMIDTEVIRLRRLRNTALRARAIAAAMDSDPTGRRSALSAGGQLCWRIARLMTGRLRAHPYLSYQRGPSEVRAAYHRVSAAILGAIARYRGRSRQIYAGELRHVARELDDTRALTWSVDFGDALGRLQTQIRRLLQELDADALAEAGVYHQAAPRAGERADAVREEAASIAGDWPYLAF
jgi:hypothetical protein